MADYRELLRRAVEALPENNGASRRQVYEKARSALVGQLRAITPPLPAREITQHRLQLEDCIRQVEQGATDALLGNLQRLDNPGQPSSEVTDAVDAVREREAKAQGEVTRNAVDTRSVQVELPSPMITEAAHADEAAVVEEIENDAAADDFDESEALDAEQPTEVDVGTLDDVEAPEVNSGADALKAALERASNVDETQDSDDVEIALGSEDEDGDDTELEAADDADIDEGTSAENEPTEEKTPESGTIDDIIAEAQQAAKGVTDPDDDGDASPEDVAPAARFVAKGSEAKDTAAGATNAAMSSVREVEVESPTEDDESGDPQGAIDRAIETLDREARGDSAADDGEKSDQDKAAEAIVASSAQAGGEQNGSNALTIFLFLFALLLAGVGGAGYWAWREGYVDMETMFGQAPIEDVAAVTETAETPATGAAVEVSEGPGNTTATPVAVETSSEELGKSAERLVSEEPAADPVVNIVEEAPIVASVDNDEDKNEERLTTDTSFNADEQSNVVDGEADVAASEATATDLVPDVVEVGGQSLLLEASSEGTTGAVPYSGTVDWTRDVDELGLPVLKARANIPARNLSVDVLLRKNSDPTLPASHLMEVDFTVTDSFLGGTVAGLPGILLKNEELVRGVPLVGASVRVLSNSFLFALSASEQDVTSNVDLLQSRKWMDLALVYATGTRAIITLEKDAAAQALFDEVMEAWRDAETVSAAQ